jgi:membrane-bound metal-dependent hydrolase YbcI (DUF457 family)
MFVGHFALGLAGKRLAPRVSLGTWFLSVQLLDLVWPVFLLLGLEQVRVTPGYTLLSPLDFYHYPWTHSLVTAILWGLGFFLVAVLVRRGPGRGAAAALLGLGVVSHWLLDAVVHRPDLPIFPLMGRYVGLGLWDRPVLAVALELALFALGTAVYLRRTTAKDSIGRWGLWILLGFLLLVWLASLFGPPPPDEGPIAWSALALWLLIPWAYWVDRHRAVAS